MALSLGVKTGSVILLGEHRLDVKSISLSNIIVVTLDGGPSIIISDKARTALLPEVYVSSGVSASGVVSRLAFEAPLEVAIVRGDAKKNEEQNTGNS